MSGLQSYELGRAAEDAAVAAYAKRGFRAVKTRWRSPAGEVDLIVRSGDALVFVEVKAARSHDVAAERISARQLGRIGRAAEVYAGDPENGHWSEIRIDAALVDAMGQVQILENISMN